MNKAQIGDRVRVQYAGLLRDGSAAAKDAGRQVLMFTVGSTEVMPGISAGVVGMAVGEEKRLTLRPKEAYGLVRRKLIKEIPRRRIPEHLALQVGKWLTSTRATTGRRRRVQVVEIKPETVVIDANHPMAGKTLEVEIQLIALDSSSAQ